MAVISITLQFLGFYFKAPFFTVPWTSRSEVPHSAPVKKNISIFNTSTVQFGVLKVKQDLKNCLGLGTNVATIPANIDLNVSLSHLSVIYFQGYFQYTFPSSWKIFYCFFLQNCDLLCKSHENTFVAPQHTYLTICPFHSFTLPNLSGFPFSLFV